jgi:hypothetical protein
MRVKSLYMLQSSGYDVRLTYLLGCVKGKHEILTVAWSKPILTYPFWRGCSKLREISTCLRDVFDIQYLKYTVTLFYMTIRVSCSFRPFRGTAGSASQLSPLFWSAILSSQHSVWFFSLPHCRISWGTGWLADSVEQSPFWEASRTSGSREIPRI